MSSELEDKIAITELVAKYNLIIDRREAEAWVDLFTEDGELKADGVVRAKGRAELLDYVKRGEAKGLFRRHWTSNLVIDLNGDTARVRLYVMVFDISKGLGAPYVMGEYDDRVVKVDGRWLFKLRDITFCAGESVGSN